MNNEFDYLASKKLLTPNQVAALLSISLSKVYQLLKDGSIPVVRIGRAVRVDPIDLAHFIQSNKDTSKTGQIMSKSPRSYNVS